MTLHAPIILLGTLRSGTTWLGSAFANHPRVAYWSEPRHIWMWRNAYRPDYRLVAADATERIKLHIQAEFERFVASRGASRFCEKTPSNCLRVPFVHEIFPDAKFVLILRDGRSVVRSSREVAERGIPFRRLWRRARQTPAREWPAYAPRAIGAMRRKLVGGPSQYWGPQPPGWKTWVQQDPPHVAMAKVWAATIRYAVDDLQALGSDQYHCLYYEELVHNPEPLARAMTDFCELEHPEPVIAHICTTADPQRARKWRRELNDATLEDIRPHIEPTLTHLGYTW